MKRRFTILTAALALLAFLAIPMGMMGQSTYTKVTTAPSDWSGTYVIVADASNVIFTGQSGSNNYGGYADVTISDNSVTGNFTAYEVEIEQSGDFYSIKHINSSKYLGWTSGNYLYFSTTAPSANTYRWKLSASSILNANDVTRKLQYNSGSPRFACYTTSQKVAYLYKKEAGSTTTCATPTFNPAGGTYIQAQTVNISCSTEGATIYYTTDGNDPTTSSTVYSGAINVSTNTTIKAMATASGYDNSAVATAEYAFITLEHAGTLEDPYSVADARAAIDANAGTQGVYATGIVSAIVTAYDAGFHNVTFNMVDEAGDEVFLQAYRCGGDEAANVAVGDVAVVYGNLTYHSASGTYEFGQGCTLVSLTHPVITTPVVTVTPNTIDAPFAGADGTLALTYENIENFISFDYYFCDANGGELQEDPNWIYAEINEENAVYSLDYLIDANDGAARTAYIKVYTYDDELEEVFTIVTVNQEEYVAPTYAELPFEFDGGHAAIENTDGLYQEGLGSDYNNSPKLKFDGAGDWLLLQFEERPGILTFDIKGNGAGSDPWEGVFKVMVSTNGIDYVDKVVYETGDLTSTKTTMTIDDLASEVRYIKWIYTTKTIGNVALGNIKLAKYVEPVLVASITVNPDEVNVDAEDHDGTLDLTYENLTITDMYDFDIQYYDAEGEEANEPDWMEVLVAEQDPEIGEGYVVSYWIMENEGTEARTVYFKVYAMDDETNLVYSNLVTINQAAPETPANPGTWVLTSLADLTEDDIFVIVGNNGDTYAMSNDEGTQFPPSTVEVIVTEGTLSGEPAANLQWNISISEDGYTFYPNGETETWLYCTNTNNGVRVGTNDNKVFTIEDGYLKNVATSRYVGIYNSQDWRCYTNTTGNIANQTFAFYKKVAQPATETHTLTINGYQNDENDGGYYLIASPVNVDPATVSGMTTDDFDLYYFDESQELEWRNYEATPFNLVPGTGYLYAKKATTENLTYSFELTGTPYSGNGTVDLTYTENAEFAGFNLIGNPFGTNAILDLPYYRLNSDGSALNTTTESSEINVMEGVFVQATAADQKANFTKVGESAKKISLLNVKVTRNRSVILDNAIIRFDNGAMLGKFQLNANSTKLYFTEGNQDFAVVRSANEGEMPINFKASENGTYTISINAENVDVNYLHLIDNMTGADVDLLATPSYSFEAKVTDYTNRFRLVFNANSSVNEQNSETFAFFNGSNLVINNEGEATLQVIDMMGRMISSEQIQGSYNNSLNLSAGVYVLRLSNGNTVKTQKIVID